MMIDKIKAKLIQLHLKACAAHLAQVVDVGAKNNLSFPQSLGVYWISNWKPEIKSLTCVVGLKAEL